MIRVVVISPEIVKILSADNLTAITASQRDMIVIAVPMVGFTVVF
jgi:hypothetical protein